MILDPTELRALLREAIRKGANKALGMVCAAGRSSVSHAVNQAEDNLDYDQILEEFIREQGMGDI